MYSKNISMKKLLGIAGAFVVMLLAAIVILVGVMKPDNSPSTTAGSYQTTQPISQSVAASDTTLQTTLPPTTAPTTLPTTAQPTTEPTTLPPVTVPPVSEPSEQNQQPTDEQILQAITDGINALKGSNASYVGTKTQNIVIDVTDCSYPAFLTVINGVVKLIANEEVLEYDFTNGRCIDPEEKVEVTANDTIPPVGIAFALTIDGVSKASVEKVGENTVYSVTLVPETGTFEQPKPPHHGVACDTLDFSLFDVPLGEITKSDFNYPGATVTVTYDKDGKVIGYSEHIDMNGVGEGQALGITATASLEGYIDESWKIVWK